MYIKCHAHVSHVVLAHGPEKLILKEATLKTLEVGRVFLNFCDEQRGCSS